MSGQSVAHAPNKCIRQLCKALRERESSGIHCADEMWPTAQLLHILQLSYFTVALGLTQQQIDFWFQSLLISTLLFLCSVDLTHTRGCAVESLFICTAQTSVGGGLRCSVRSKEKKKKKKKAGRLLVAAYLCAPVSHFRRPKPLPPSLLIPTVCNNRITRRSVAKCSSSLFWVRIMRNATHEVTPP